MSQPAHEGVEIIPRPEQNPPALKAALAMVAADRLPEMRPANHHRRPAAPLPPPPTQPLRDQAGCRLGRLT